MALKYELPAFLTGKVTREKYVRWLQRKAQAHAVRDRKRWKQQISVSTYKLEIHAAVKRSKGRDHYTNERLDWMLLSKYDNAKSRAGGTAYKSQFALLPTVDHADPRKREPDFAICGWRTNDCKNDLTIAELRAFCRKVLAQ
jgi:hypothetical protein